MAGRGEPAGVTLRADEEVERLEQHDGDRAMDTLRSTTWETA